MHHLRSIRRLAVGTAITGAAIGAAPALASASSTCFYNGINRTLEITDGSGPEPLRLVADKSFLLIADGTSAPATTCGGSNTAAQTGNTDTIAISGPLTNALDGYIVDLSGGPFAPGKTLESDGNSEIEIVATSNSAAQATLTVEGGPGHDEMRAGANGAVDLGDTDVDRDPDITMSAPAFSLRLRGNDGDDTLTGQGFGTGNATMPVSLRGGNGNDRLEGGSGRDTLRGDAGDDTLFSFDTSAGDALFGGSGIDAGNADSNDVFGDVIEKPFVISVGRLRLAPKVLKAEAGKTARLKMSWQHPKRWRELRTVRLTAYHGKQAVGTVTARPAAGGLASTGAVRLMSGSKLSHHGKWVTAALALRLPKSLAGETLRVDVMAADRDGHKNVERRAGTIRVAA
jgi:RTX calcium-binding nonapeptide repeat (4 copies)